MSVSGMTVIILWPDYHQVNSGTYLRDLMAMKWLGTYANHRLLPPADKDVNECIADFIAGVNK